MYSDFEMNINSLLKSQLYDKQKRSKEPKITTANVRRISATGSEPAVRPSIYGKPNGDHYIPPQGFVPRRSDIAPRKVPVRPPLNTSPQKKMYARNKPSHKKSSKSFIAYLFRGNNIRVIAVSTSVILLLALCSFALNGGDNEQSAAGVNNHTYSFAGGTAKFSASNPAFGAISENVSFTVTDGITEPRRVSILPGTVGEAFARLGILLNPEDIVNYDMNDVITDGINIIILRTDSKIHQVSEEIAFATQVIEVDTIKKGTTQVARKGVAGLKVKYYEQNYTNDVLDEEIKTGEKIIKEPVDEIIYKGVGGTFKAPDGKTYNYSYVLNVQATAYGDVSGGKNPNWDGITYTGTQVRTGVIAVDPSVISLGSAVYVTGEYGDFGICSAEDTGKAVKGAIVDIYMESKEEMVKFGRREMKAYILE